MFSKAFTALVAASVLLAAQTAVADDGHGWKKGPHKHRGGQVGYDYAEVVDVDPIVRQVRVTTPRRECWTETRYEYDTRYESVPVGGGYERPHRSSAGSMILGGIIGGVIGHQIGSGDGNRAATVAGALIGSAIGHDAANRRSGPQYATREVREERPYDVERCDVRYDEEYEERVDGYRVTYLYNGREHTTRLPYDPGDRIRVRVDVRPDDDY
jgi:uncharacterized protein YcfJ